MVTVNLIVNGDTTVLPFAFYPSLLPQFCPLIFDFCPVLWYNASHKIERTPKACIKCPRF